MIKKRKLKDISFKKAFHQGSFTISDVIFGCLNLYDLSDVQRKNIDPVSLYSRGESFSFRLDCIKFMFTLDLHFRFFYPSDI